MRSHRPSHQRDPPREPAVAANESSTGARLMVLVDGPGTGMRWGPGACPKVAGRPRSALAGTGSRSTEDENQGRQCQAEDADRGQGDLGDSQRGVPELDELRNHPLPAHGHGQQGQACGRSDRRQRPLRAGAGSRRRRTGRWAGRAASCQGAPTPAWCAHRRGLRPRVAILGRMSRQAAAAPGAWPRGGSSRGGSSVMKPPARRLRRRCPGGRRRARRPVWRRTAAAPGTTAWRVPCGTSARPPG